MKSEPFVEVDLHGLTVDEARDRIEKVLKSLDRSTYHVRLIHGFNRGVRIKSMIKREYSSDSRLKRIMPGDNMGITVLVIREL